MDRVLMLGNEAIARGAWEAGVHVVSSYPGTPSTEITETIAAFPEVYSEWAVNEKVSLEVCAGAAYAGARAMCCMKHVGLNVAADPLFTLSYTGVSGGLVIVVADDPGMNSSQNEQDSRWYARADRRDHVDRRRGGVPGAVARHQEGAARTDGGEHPRDAKEVSRRQRGLAGHGEPRHGRKVGHVEGRYQGLDRGRRGLGAVGR